MRFLAILYDVNVDDRSSLEQFGIC